MVFNISSIYGHSSLVLVSFDFNSFVLTYPMVEYGKEKESLCMYYEVYGIREMYRKI